MINNEVFIKVIAQNGFKTTSGVPCSSISRLFHALDTSREVRHFGASTEGEAIGIISGTWLAGKRAAVFCQNSGVGNMINPLVSLNDPYAIPTMIFVSMRGVPGYPDEAQHEIMGARSGDFLRLANIEVEKLPKELNTLEEAFEQAVQNYNNRRSHAFLIDPKTFENSAYIPEAITAREARQSGDIVIAKDDIDITRHAAIEIIARRYTNNLTIATTGMISRELYAVTGKKPNHFLMAGSMGHASAIGFGVAQNVNAPVIALDGDGALLMKMGTCATIGRYAPKNLMHVVLDNGVHGSTGNNKSNAVGFDFALVAKASGYKQIYSCSGQSGISEVVGSIDNTKGPIFMHCHVSSEEKIKFPRPNMDMKEHAMIFREHASHLDSS